MLEHSVKITPESEKTFEEVLRAPFSIYRSEIIVTHLKCFVTVGLVRKKRRSQQENPGSSDLYGGLNSGLAYQTKHVKMGR